LRNIEVCEIVDTLEFAEFVISNGVFTLCADKSASFDQFVSHAVPRGTLHRGVRAVAPVAPVTRSAGRDHAHVILRVGHVANIGDPASDARYA
jgi:hypothetical protein